MALLVASSDTLDAFATGLAGTNTGPDASTEKGAIPLPVAGQVIRQFEQPDAAGIRRPGILIATRPQAMITTPVSATIRFIGSLLDYGTVVILEPAANTLWIFAGLNEAFGTVGQIVPDGTPIGLMGGQITNAQGILNQSAQGSAGQRTQTLYLEVRDRQSAVDPAE
jgi:septal ring factor EnvC (AmiA/AmiB activator)